MKGRGDSVLFARYTGGDSVLVNKKERGGFCPGGFCPDTVLAFCCVLLPDTQLQGHLRG